MFSGISLVSELRKGWGQVAKVNGSAEILDMGQARARLRPADLKASDFPTVGAYFSAVREAAGYSIQDIASRTHIRAAYLNAIELMAIDELPSRPFALGFIKTYADALGVDAAAAVAKFKENTGAPSHAAEPVPQLDEPSQPEAVDEKQRPLLTLIGFLAVLGFILFCAIMIVMPKETSAPYKLNTTAIPGAVTEPVAASDAPAETPAEGAPPAPLPVISGPILIEGVDPVYPRRCENGAQEIERVEIAFNVSTAGTVVGERVASSTNPCLNDAALNAARLWRYSPRTVDAQRRMAYDQRHVFEFKRP